jgi:nucleoside-diphosphate-sugar epimerase
MPAALVTGANGFIGSRLVRTLLERGWTVRSLVLKGTPLEFLDGVRTEVFFGDICEPETLGPALEGMDTVFHLAALARDWGPADLFMKVNAAGTRNMLEAASAAGASRLVLASSLAVHDYCGHFGANEDAAMDCPAWLPYGRSKVMAERHVKEFHDRGVIEGVIIRPGVFPFGPNDTTSFSRLAAALEKGIFAYVDHGRARLCTAYVENLCHGMELAGRRPGAAGRTYVIADDAPLSWRELMELFCRELGAKPPRLSIPYPAARAAAVATETLWTRLGLRSEPPLTLYRARIMRGDLFFVSGRARDELGYAPTVPLEEGVRRTVAWYRYRKSF